MEDKIKKEEWVRTADGKIGIFDRYSSRKEESYYKSPFDCFVRLKKRKTPLQCCRDYIIKHSKNIIDLIEVGDYVNEYKIFRIDELEGKSKKIFTVFEQGVTDYLRCWNNEDIKSILTKEQYEEICYKVEE